ncbi:hypothetical protein [Actinomadura oligospora]|uniref:hypothetical protein n=1 Tax=Actinomadura oligospora TaxID=111804 RepID=UPI00047D3F4A|nr:hypothetical protein [Actinomadura oligospora]
MRVRFTEPQEWDGITAEELSINAARVVFLNADGKIIIEADADVIRSVDQGSTARMGRLREAHPNHGVAWQEHERTTLREMWAAKVPMPELVKHFGRSRNSIGSEARRLGLPKDREVRGG